MAKYVYRVDNGALVSWCPGDADPVANAEDLAAKGYAVKTGLPALDDAHAWDPATQSVIAVVAPAAPNWVPTWRYIKAFTPAESAAIRASADQQVQHILYMLQFTQSVDLNSVEIQQGIGYLISVGLLTQQRAVAILATEAS